MTAFETLILLTGQMESTLKETTPQVSNSYGMLFACWSIVVVIVAMFIIFMRAHKKDYALAIMPLVIVPLMHIFSAILSKLLVDIFPLKDYEIRVLLDLTAALVTCLLLGLSSRQIAEKRTRNALFVCCSGFIIILSIVLIVNIFFDARI